MSVYKDMSAQEEKPMPFPVPVVPPSFREGTQKGFAQEVYNSFFNFHIQESEKQIGQLTSLDWEKEGQKRALDLFHATAERVPAYKDYLKKQKIKHELIKTIEDFRNIPPIDKENYLRLYSVKDLSWDGELHSSQIISVSSGSTGKPFFWPRGLLTELETTYIFELILKSFFETDKKSTLFINAFAMGMYVGGPITLNCVLRVAQKGHKITIVTPGYSLEEIHRIVIEVGSLYDQVVLASYPPFARDVIGEGIEKGIDWKRLSLKFLLAGEGYSEGWRDYLAELSGSHPVRDFINLYGTADAAVLGHESPTSILLRKIFDRDRESRKNIFGDERLPSVLQYYPTSRYFEVLNNKELVFTASAGIPLIRYNIHDRGGLMTFDEARSVAGSLGANLEEAVGNAQIKSVWQLPLVYVFGRSDFTTVFYGANVYPENIKVALEEKEICRKVTGKFTMFTEDDSEHNQQLIINIECAQGINPSLLLERKIQKIVINKLRQLNSEYGVAYKARGKKAKPKIRLFPRSDGKYFNGGIKQKWTLKFD